MTFNRAEYKIIAELLELAYQQFSNHGCNDFELERNDVNATIIAQAERADYPDISEDDLRESLKCGDDQRIVTRDDFLMRYFSERCKKLAEKVD